MLAKTFKVAFHVVVKACKFSDTSFKAVAKALEMVAKAFEVVALAIATSLKALTTI